MAPPSHPLYAFLRPPTVDAPSPTLPPRPLPPPSQPRPHSPQLDSIILILNSLLSRIDSLDALSHQAHDDLHLKLDSLKAHADNLALSTSSKTENALSPRLGSLNVAMGLLNRQITSLASDHSNSQNDQSGQSSCLSRIEKDLDSLKHDFRRLDNQLLQNTHQASRAALKAQQDIQALSSSLLSLASLAPLLEKFLTAHLHPHPPPKVNLGQELTHSDLHLLDRPIRKLSKRSHSDMVKKQTGHHIAKSSVCTSDRRLDLSLNHSHRKKIRIEPCLTSRAKSAHPQASMASGPELSWPKPAGIKHPTQAIPVDLPEIGLSATTLPHVDEGVFDCKGSRELVRVADATMDGDSQFLESLDTAAPVLTQSVPESNVTQPNQDYSRRSVLQTEDLSLTSAQIITLPHASETAQDSIQPSSRNEIEPIVNEIRNDQKSKIQSTACFISTNEIEKSQVQADLECLPKTWPEPVPSSQAKNLSDHNDLKAEDVTRHIGLSSKPSDSHVVPKKNKRQLLIEDEELV